MKPFHPSILATGLLSLALAGPAHALSCEEIVAMIEVGVPIPIVVGTIDDSGGTFDTDKLACLAQAEVPVPVLEAARALRAIEEATGIPQPAPALTTPTASRPDEGTPEEISRALRLLSAHKPASASVLLADLLAEQRYPTRAGQLHFHLGLALQELDLPIAAEGHYLATLERGPSDPWFDHALLRLVELAERSGDPTTLRRVVARVPPEAWPARARPTLAWYRGLQLLEQEDLNGALAILAQVPSDSAHGLQARYTEGVIRNRQGRLHSAVKAFTEVIQAEPRGATRAEAQRLRDLQNLALMDVARMHYGLQRFAEAEALYGKVEPESTVWATARFEMAWAQFMQDDTSGSMGQLLTVRSPFFDEEPFLPEAEVLRALNLFTLCDYGEVERILLDFEARVRPWQRELASFARGYAEPGGRELADRAWATFFESFPADSTLPGPVFVHLLKNRDLQAQVIRLEGIEDELARIGEQKARWQDSLGEPLTARLEAERQRTRRRAGLLLLAGAASLSADLADLLAQSEIIRFEANDARRMEIEYLISGPTGVALPPVASAEIPYSTSTEQVWPFNGEFWEDELGSYVFVGQSDCR